MSRPSRPEPVAAIGKRPVPPPLQNLHHRLLDETIQHRGDAELSHPAVRFGDFHPPHRLRLVGPTQQLFSDRNITKTNPFPASANLALVDGDIGDPKTAARIVDTAVSRFGRVDVLIN